MSYLQTSTPNTESFAALFEESLTKQDMRSGEVISAEVVRVDHNFVVVNAGLKSEAYIPLEEFMNDQGELEVQVGDFVSVAIDSLENGYRRHHPVARQGEAPGFVAVAGKSNGHQTNSSPARSTARSRAA